MEKTKQLKKQDIEDILALTPLQEGMLYHYLKEPDSDLYFEQLCLRLSGIAEKDIFEKAWHVVAAGNEMLRTVFRWQKMKKPVQIVLKEHRPELRTVDLSRDRAEQKETLIEELKIRDRKEKFDLREVPFRVTLIKLDEDKYEVMISNHHILYDGWSNGIILREFFAAYAALSEGKKPVAVEKRKFKEFVTRVKNRDRLKQEQFWREYLSGFDTPAGLPVKRAAGRNFIAASVFRTEIKQDIRQKMETWVKGRKVTLAALLYCAYGILLQKYTNKDDVLFGTTLAGRSAKIEGIEDIVGLFINTLPLRVQSLPGEKAGTLLSRINEGVQEREQYETTPLVEIGEMSALAGSEELFDSIMVIENYPVPEELTSAQGGLGITGYSMFEMTNYDVTIALTLSENIGIDFIYNKQVLTEAVIERLAGHFINILASMRLNPGSTPGELEMLSAPEKKQLVFEFNRREADFIITKTIPRLFEEQVERYPDKPALIGSSANEELSSSRGGDPDTAGDPAVHVLTYRQLDEASDRLARLLVEKGVEGNPLVGISVGRRIEMIIGILGILKSCCGYVPLNPKAPAGRNEYILDECGVTLLLTTRSVSEVSEELPFETVFIEEGINPAKTFDEECRSKFPSHGGVPEGRGGLGDSEPGTPIRRARPGDYAYVIFTSGSTGKPKGVPITHANFCALMHWGYAVMQLGPQDRVVQNLSYYFDWSVWEIFITLTSGAALYMVREDVLLDPKLYAGFMNDNGITTLHITPTQFQTLTYTGLKLEKMKHLAIGAEKLTLDLVRRAFALINDDCRVYNMYGPTEATIMAAVLEIDKGNEEFYKKLSSIPIGPPIANTDFFILDKNMNPLPLYASGELYIGGDGISTGYLNNPELSAEKFASSGPLFEKSPTCVGEHLGDDNSKMMESPVSEFRFGANGCTRRVPKTFHKSFCGVQGRFFQKEPLPTGGKLYKTGDLAGWLPDGTVEFLGRIDQQVKIRGFRIEPGEIENELLRHEAVKEAFVMVRQDGKGDNYLCAYIVGPTAWARHVGRDLAASRHIPEKQGHIPVGDAYMRPVPGNDVIDAAELRRYLSQRLPGYMIPAYFVGIEKMPLNPNGKIDLKALPEPGAANMGREIIAPADEVEEKLVEAWCDVLGFQRTGELSVQVSVTDNFFESGGHSLKAAGFLSLLHKEFDVEIPLAELFEKPTIKELARYIKQADKSRYSGLQPAREQEYYPLSPAQKRLYVLQQMENESVAYNMTGVLLMEGEIDKKKFEHAFITLTARHESLRTSFHELAEETVQKIHSPGEIDFKMEYLEAGIREEKAGSREQGSGISVGTRRAVPSGHASGGPLFEKSGAKTFHEGPSGLNKSFDQTFSKVWPPAGPPEASPAEPGTVNDLIDRFVRPFDLSAAPLLRVGLIEVGKTNHVLIVDMHHIISDGSSMAILIKEFVSLLKGEELPPPGFQYKDYAVWLPANRGKGTLKEQESFWLKEFADEIPVLDLPTDFPRPAIQSFAGDQIGFEINEENTAAIRRLALQESVTPYIVLLAAFDIFLSKISGREDIVTGTVTAGRGHADLESTIGMFVNTLPLRLYPAGEKTIADFIREAKDRTLKARENQAYQFEDLVDKLDVKRDASRNPLFDVMLVLQNVDISQIEIPGLKISPFDYNSRMSKFDMTFICVELERRLSFTIEYSTKLFTKETIERFADYYKTIISFVIHEPGIKISEIIILPEEDRKKILDRFNHGAEAYPDKTVVDLFEEQVADAPGNIAWFERGNYITYDVFNKRADVVAKIIEEL